MILGINASRARSGGAKAHLIGILTEGDPARYGFREVHVWSYPELLNVLPDRPWLIKHSPAELTGSIFRQVWWERFSLPKELRAIDCSILFNVDAGSVCRFSPVVTMSQDMLAYEPGEMSRYGLSKAYIRLILLRFIQARSMKRSDGVIFLTNYASRIIQGVTGKLQHLSVIPHGVGEVYRQTISSGEWPDVRGRTIRCLYVSNAAMYKHQWVVVRAIGELRKCGYNVSLLLAGGGAGKAQRMLDDAINQIDPLREFIDTIGFVPHDKLPGLLTKADIFVFASSCENMPNTLLEGMASGLPIACSNRGPMPEVLADGGVYFDPEDAISIADAVKQIIDDSTLRATIVQRVKKLSDKYSWSRCASETFSFMVESYENWIIKKKFSFKQ
ncbi:MAG: glycosyltransferase family 1 protein [Candidatus Scalindua sp. AMX11]|nr:MAG: glycosyltransferase family 1 protein [Candidatus Scalindua sp.]NOG82952.1 glycosyltransferase family 4 protein [Planctomycetota bacterium]RZV68765.1 MAG: glycosyltransferase family 1 protein [Candidatus Scalindua sp. SCAELEC01]TDE63827.1 MAG: glycosyltransferase family 1 protein [Candidatus Scalindua sp. AMX11]